MHTRRRIVSRQVEPSEWDAVRVLLCLAVCAAGTLLLLVGATGLVLVAATHWCRLLPPC
jgi:hypothetical protein